MVIYDLLLINRLLIWMFSCLPENLTMAYASLATLWYVITWFILKFQDLKSCQYEAIQYNSLCYISDD